VLNLRARRFANRSAWLCSSRVYCVSNAARHSPEIANGARGAVFLFRDVMTLVYADLLEEISRRFAIDGCRMISSYA
jgi:hypothetical protein